VIPAYDAPKRPALRYYGGKWRLAPWIISHFPEHKNYVEPCGGAASVLLQKPRSPLETYNDLDGNVVNFFRVLRDRPDELIRKIRLTPFAREEAEAAKWKISGDDIDRARVFFVRCNFTVSARPGGGDSANWGPARFHGQCYTNRTWDVENIKDGLSFVSDRLMGVQIENRDALRIVSDYDHVEAVIYFDPPYVPDTRAQSDVYLIEQDNQFHIESATLLRQCQGYVVVSGYACDLYTELYEAYGWSRYDKEAQTNSGGKRIESLWLSPRTVKALNKPVQQSLLSEAV
jgi:DNA adenine methylase